MRGSLAVNSESIPVEQMCCPVCSKGVLESRVLIERFDYGEGADKVSVVAENVPVRVCTHCQERFSGPEAARIRHLAICRALGLLTPEEIRAIRERFGPSQAGFARLTGIGEATVSRWERGRLLQNKAMDRYLRLLDSNPDTLRIMRQLIGTDPPPPLGRDRFRKLGGAKLEHYSQNRDQLLKSLNFAGSN
jgi:putative zinc finger/helix-turn-helix YgiT family protein